MLLRCPVCDQQLEIRANAYYCPQGHTFDIARQGYVNLLLSTGSQPTIQGDTREMLGARRRFLEEGHYQPLSDHLNRRAVTIIHGRPHQGGPYTILDAGCGEGYYLGRLQHFLSQQLPDRDFCQFGMDLSRDAVRLAAGKYKGITFFVANTYKRFLFAEGTVDLLLNLFAPRNPAEFHRVMRKNGTLFVVIPGPTHLASLRHQLSLLDIEEDKEEKLTAQMEPLFRLEERHILEYELTLDAEAITTLLQMTPNYWHLSDETWKQVASLEPQPVQLNFTSLQFRPQ
jgi:23S rRNA (guanine745-N1)-methyltransferase